MSRLSNLISAYKKSDGIYHATLYWNTYEQEILETINKIDINELRSGKYPILATFGFNDVVYTYHPYMPLWKKITFKFIHKHLIKNRPILPYGLSLSSIREMAYHHCELKAELTGSVPISDIGISDFGNPADLFEVNDKKYTISFLDYYLRYCFANKHIDFNGEEIIVELGSGSGHQIEVLKKIYPKATIFCFDLPLQIYLCETYLSNALGEENIVSTSETQNWQSLEKYKKGCVHFLGNWQFPLLKNFKFDVFWNAASFGEMEPEVVKHYLSYIKDQADWVYLLQARHGKETAGITHVRKSIAFDDYREYLSGYALHGEEDVYQSVQRLSASGGYFEAIWKKMS